MFKHVPFFVLALLLSLGSAAFAQSEAKTQQRRSASTSKTQQKSASSTTKTQAKDIVDTAVEAKKFSTLVAAVKAAGLANTLKGTGPFTVFAPTDAAFKKLPAGTLESLLKEENLPKLKQILTYHVVSGKVMSADVAKLTEAATVQGDKVAIKVENGKVTFNDANLMKADIVCANGVIHVIDTVLLPGQKDGTLTSAKKDIVDTAMEAGKFSTLIKAVKAAGLAETLKGDGPFTVFAPSDEAFAKIPAEKLKDLLKPENKEKLSSILTYHVVSGKVMAADVVKLQKAKTVNGKEVQIKVTDKGVTLDSANVVKTDIECGNGVIHIIDSVIMPK